MSTSIPATPDLNSPFAPRHPGAVGPTSSPATPAGVEVGRVERVEKPWGYEEVFGVLEGRYVGKVLHLRAGAALSLQKHALKDETMCVQSGRVSVEIGEDARDLATVVLEPGQTLHVRANVVHRMVAVVESQVLEVSTAWPGWREDIVRLVDAYGRQGTSAP